MRKVIIGIFLVLLVSVFVIAQEGVIAEEVILVETPSEEPQIVEGREIIEEPIEGLETIISEPQILEQTKEDKRPSEFRYTPQPHRYWEGDVDSDVYNRNLGNVGIGTQYPSQKLEINGGLLLNPNVEKPACSIETAGTLWVENYEFVNSLEFCKMQLAGGLEASVEIKDATLPSGRYMHSCAENSATNKVYCFGGFNLVTSFNQIVEYDPVTDTSTIKATTLPSGIYGLFCVENSATHKIYCMGGVVGLQTRTDNILEYDPSLDSITLKSAKVPTERSHFSCTENSATNKIYCLGGGHQTHALSDIFEYNPATDTTQVMPVTLPRNVSGFTCAINSSTNKIYCFGGYDLEYLDQIIEYDIATNSVRTMTARLPTARNLFSCVENSVTHKIYCFGGDNSGHRFNEILEYDSENDSISILSVTLPTGITGLSCAENFSNHKIYCFGGNNFNNEFINTIFEFSSITTDIFEWVRVA